jgi:hypothetical protein
MLDSGMVNDVFNATGPTITWYLSLFAFLGATLCAVVSDVVLMACPRIFAGFAGVVWH